MARTMDGLNRLKTNQYNAGPPIGLRTPHQAIKMIESIWYSVLDIFIQFLEELRSLSPDYPDIYKLV